MALQECSDPATAYLRVECCYQSHSPCWLWHSAPPTSTIAEQEQQLFVGTSMPDDDDFRCCILNCSRLQDHILWLTLVEHDLWQLLLHHQGIATGRKQHGHGLHACRLSILEQVLLQLSKTTSEVSVKERK
jgi:hypothetical protein